MQRITSLLIGLMLGLMTVACQRDKDIPMQIVPTPLATPTPLSATPTSLSATITPTLMLPDEPDAVALGKNEGYPCRDAATMFWDRFKVGCFSGTDKILPTRFVARGNLVMPLAKEAATDITYRFNNTRYTLADYLAHQRVTGLLILKNDKIVAEQYRYGRSEQDRFRSASIAKSITSMLIGIALDKGILTSLDDRAEKYVPELRGHGYGQATFRELLRMSAGVQFVEKYDGHDDVAKLGAAELGHSSYTPLQLLASYNVHTSSAGEKFSYASSEASVMGYVLSRAAGKNLTTLTSDWLWQPLGAEADAAWNVGVDGQEGAEGKFNATLRDYGRLGLLLVHDGAIGGKQIIPQPYLLEATDAAYQPLAFRPRVATSYYGDGYFFWLLPMRSRTFVMLGVYGQAMYIQPASGIVMVQTAVNKEPSDAAANAERDALWRGVLSALGGYTDE